MSVLHAKNQIPTIDVNLVTIETAEGEFGFDTANQVEVEVQTEDEDAVRLVVKGILRAQKQATTTITGHQLTLHDNVFIPELVKVLQGGTVYYYTDGTHTATTTDVTDYGFAKYTPPLAGSADKGEIFKLNCYSAIYNAAGVITGYEKTTYPNCKGVPVAFNSEDGAFRAPEYTINSAPDTGEAPYEISTVPSLPTLTGKYNTDGPAASVTSYGISYSLTSVTTSNSTTTAVEGTSYETNIAAEEGYTINNILVTMGGTDITAGSYNAETGDVIISPVTDDITITASATINTYSIANALTQVTTSNNARSIVHGEAYNATLTPNEGYAIDTLTVTMGGEDVTSQVAVGGVISISAVTGDLVITAIGQVEVSIVLDANLKNS